jgi:alkylation response protein AidB-like acyl-CoA dehydrogenase
MAKALGAHFAWAFACNSLQIHGSYWFAFDYKISRILNILEGTAETKRR